MKKLYIGLLVAAVGAFTLYGADSIGTDSGVTRTYSPSRWNVAKTGNEVMSGSTATTNVITTVNAMLGKIVFVPSAVTDAVKIYTARTGAGASASNLIMEYAANSPTMGNSPTLALGTPIVYDLTPGWSATNGIVVISTRVSISTALKSYIGWGPAVTTGTQ